jgi:hypothetical protein
LRPVWLGWGRAWINWSAVDRLDATGHRFGRTMRRWMIVLTVLSIASTNLTVYLALHS